MGRIDIAPAADPASADKERITKRQYDLVDQFKKISIWTGSPFRDKARRFLIVEMEAGFDNDVNKRVYPSEKLQQNATNCAAQARRYESYLHGIRDEITRMRDGVGAGEQFRNKVAYSDATVIISSLRVMESKADDLAKQYEQMQDIKAIEQKMAVTRSYNKFDALKTELKGWSDKCHDDLEVELRTIEAYAKKLLGLVIVA